MKPTDKKEFFALLADVHDMYQTTCSVPAAELWFAALEAQQLPKIRDAILAHTRHATFGKFCPKPADVMREIESNSTPDYLSGAI